MALTPTRIDDEADYFNNSSALTGASPTTLATPPATWGCYFDRLDRLYFNTFANSGSSNFVGWVDPLFNEGAAPMAQLLQKTVVGNFDIFCVGEWDRQLSLQNFYARLSGNQAIQKLDPNTLSVLDADVWPNVGWSGTRNGKASTTDGFYGSVASEWLIFESLGYAIVPSASVRYGGTTYSSTPIRVDLVTGDAVPESDFVTRHQSSPNVYQGPTLFGDTFTLTRAQFVPDEDSTPAAPKGFILIHAHQRVAGPAGTDYVYAKWIDWNPTSKTAAAGTTPRIHKRERLVTRFEVPTAAYPAGINVTYDRFPVVWHQNSRQLRMFAFRRVSATPALPAECPVAHFATQPAVSAISAPAQQAEVQTGRTTDFVVQAYGTLGELISGVDLAFTLERISTFDELLDTSGGAGSSSAVTQQMDDDPDFQPIVKKDGVALTAGADYTVDYVNNEIDFIAPEPVGGSVYTLDYRHRTDPATPPHGTLLNTAARTDEDGETVARVRYADDADLVNQLDKLSAATT